MGGARTRPRASGRRSCDSEEKRFAVNTETRMGWVGCFNGPQQRNGEKRSRHDEVLEAKEQPASLGGEPAGQLGLARPGRPGNPDLSGNECRGRHVSALSALAVGARGARTGEEEKRRRGERRRRRRGEERTRRGQEKEDKSTRGQENRREEKRGENEMTKACGGPQGTGEGGGADHHHLGPAQRVRGQRGQSVAPLKDLPDLPPAMQNKAGSATTNARMASPKDAPPVCAFAVRR